MSRGIFVPLALAAVLAAVLWFALRPASRPGASSAASAAAPVGHAIANIAAAIPPPSMAAIPPPPTGVPPALKSELAKILALTEPDERFRRLDDFWRRWFAQDREGMFLAIADLAPGDERAQALAYALPELASSEPEQALELALRLATDERAAPVFASLFDFFARQDLARAQAWLARVPPGVGFEPAWRAYTDVYAQSDLASALAWAAALPVGAGRTLAFEAALYTQAERDPFVAFELTMKNLDGEARDRGLYQALSRIIPDDPAGAATLITMMPASPQRALAIADAVRAWADGAPEKALAWAATLPPDAAAEAAVATANILQIWSRADEAKALEAFAALPPGQARDAAVERLAVELATASPEKALAWAASLPAGTEQEQAMKISLGAWAMRNPALAADWTLAIGVDTDRGTLFGEVLSHWAIQDLSAATKYVQALTDPSAQQAAAVALAPYLTQNDPLAALRWARELPEAAQIAAMRAVYRQWLANDATAAQAWAVTPEGRKIEGP
jgi:hypothetical protein